MSTIIYGEAKQFIDYFISEIINRVINNRWETIKLGGADTLFIFNNGTNAPFTFQQLATEITFQVGLPPNILLWERVNKEEDKKEEEISYYSIDNDGPKELAEYVESLLEKSFAEYIEKSNSEEIK